MAKAKEFSASDVFLHTTKDDCWLLIHGKVYDVTKFLEDHPGGEDVILDASANGDATEAFENVCHSSSAKEMMNKYLIGSVDGYVTPPKDTGTASRDSNSFKTDKPAASPPLVGYITPLNLLVITLAVALWCYYTFVSKNKE